MARIARSELKEQCHAMDKFLDGRKVLISARYARMVFKVS